MLRTLAHVMVKVRDLEESVAFYQDVLGLKEAFRLYGDDGAVRIVYLHVGDRQFVELSLGSGDAPGTNAIGYNHICFEVEGINDLYQRLLPTGCVVEGSLRRGKDKSWQFWLKDPSGNRIELMEYNEESEQTPFVPS